MTIEYHYNVFSKTLTAERKIMASILLGFPPYFFLFFLKKVFPTLGISSCTNIPTNTDTQTASHNHYDFLPFLLEEQNQRISPLVPPSFAVILSSPFYIFIVYSI